MLLLKIFLSCVVVLLITWLSETKSGFLGAIAAGFPSAYAIILLFIGISQTIEFSTTLVETSFLALFSVLVFEVFYFFGLKYFGEYRKFLTPVLAVIVLLLVNFSLLQIPFSLFYILLFSLSSLVFFHFLFRKIQPVDISICKKKLTTLELLFRMFVASSLIVLITEMANYAPAEYVGIFALFPVNILAVLIILQRYNSAEQIATMLKHHPFGLLSVFAYSSSFLLLIPYFSFLQVWAFSFIPAIAMVSLSLLGKKLSSNAKS